MKIMANSKPDFLAGPGAEKSGNNIWEPAPPQKTGGDDTIDPGSIPAGGVYPKPTPGAGNNDDVGVGSPDGGRKPYKLNG